ncbi:hypothetical protein DY000_02030172 [Brassica cretica]|uniref:Uncharacterized protein n=1 Tax=Brassica cretica TaxID=69181 RepID=A0ABQ7DIR5_BRACR|nr:hypothetical protein DY000_02030172 [Brassica cretica]
MTNRLSVALLKGENGEASHGGSPRQGKRQITPSLSLSPALMFEESNLSLGGSYRSRLSHGGSDRNRVSLTAALIEIVPLSRRL